MVLLGTIFYSICPLLCYLACIGVHEHIESQKPVTTVNSQFIDPKFDIREIIVDNSIKDLVKAHKERHLNEWHYNPDNKLAEYIYSDLDFISRSHRRSDVDIAGLNDNINDFLNKLA